MKKNWDLEELIEYITFMQNELDLLKDKTKETQLGFAILFKFFQYEARFPSNKKEVPKDIISFISKQLNLKSILFDSYKWNGRTIMYHKAKIRMHFNFRKSTTKDAENMIEWLSKLVFSYNENTDNLVQLTYDKYKELRVELPTLDRITRIVKAAIHKNENQFFQEVFKKLSKDTILKIDSLINNLISSEKKEVKCETEITFTELRADPGRTSLDSILREISKLKSIKNLELPEDLFKKISNKILKKYKQRVTSEDIRELRRHPETTRYTLVSAVFWIREREITDNLIELLIQTIHKINVRAEGQAPFFSRKPHIENKKT